MNRRVLAGSMENFESNGKVSYCILYTICINLKSLFVHSRGGGKELFKSVNDDVVICVSCDTVNKVGINQE